MGIPAFYRWISERYPKCVKRVQEDAPVTLNGVTLPVDTTSPNPNGVEFDNLYLDINGIIHPCFHPEAVPAPTTYEEVFEGVFKYIDRIFSIIRPRKLLFLAIDGVAPRAKMNQQRSRRFRTAKYAADKALGTERLRNTFESGGEKSSLLEQSKNLDSNVITPGTEFMDLLSSALRYYIYLRMNEDLGWKGIKVILSDASIPGEGEHKIMSYIRLQRNLPGYDPNTRHCLYGLDADLIMLALVTHEIHFTILREDDKLNLEKVPKCKKQFVVYKKLREKKKMKKSGNLEDYIARQNFQFFNIWTLREYLAHDLRIQGLTVEADLERLIDDFVFMCLFVGNDFLPQIPSLEISEGAINLLLIIYKNGFVSRGGYLTDSFEVNLERVEHFLRAVGDHEHKILKKRGMFGKQRQICSQRLSNNEPVSDSPNLPLIEQNIESPLDCITASVCQDPQKQYIGTEIENTSVNCEIVGMNPIVDKIKMGEKAWKERFYAEKFEAKTEDDRERIQRDAVFKYIEGICWVMRYYYEGLCSWQWFYPYHYAPLASDFHGIDKLEIHFSLGKPFKPFDQLMGVLPAASAHALPLFYRKLMTDASSPILDFYPTDFELDMNGKRFSWQAICKLPFIEESRLLSEIAKVEHTLTDEEKRRNSSGLDVLFVHISHPLGVVINSFCKQMNGDMKFLEAEVKQKINPEFSGGMNGYVCFSDKSVWPVEMHSPVEGMKMIAKNEVLSVFYNNPPFHSHIPRPLPGVILPEKSVELKDERKLLSKSMGRKLSSLQRRVSKRSIPESVASSCQAKLARGLVPQDNLRKQPETEGRDDHAGAGRLEETQTEVKTRKRKQKSKKRKHNEIGGVSNIIVEKLHSCDFREHKKGDGDGANAGGLQGTKPEVNADGLQGIKTKLKSRKKKRKSKKRKASEADDIPHTSIVKLESSSLGEQNKGDGNNASADGLHGTKTEVDANGLQGTKPEVNTNGLQGMKTELKSKKKKRRPKKRKLNEVCDVPHKIVEKLESSFPREQNKGDGNQASLDGLQGTKTEVNADGLGLQGIRTEVDTNGLHQGIRAEVITNALQGAKTEMNADGLQGIRIEVDANGLHRAIRAEVNMNALQGAKTEVNEDGLQGTRTEANANELHQGIRTEVNASGMQGTKAAVKSRKKKRRPKKKILNEGGDAPCKGVEKLESFSPNEQNKGDGNQAGADEMQGTIAGVNAIGSQGVKIEVNGLQGTKAEVMNANGLHGTKAEVNPNGLQGINTEVNSRKRKRRPKKKKPSEGVDIPHQSVDILDSSLPGEQHKGDDNQASADVLQGTKTEVNSNGLQGTITEVNTNLLQGIKTDVKSRKRKQRSKNRKLSEGGIVSLKSVEKSESSSPSEQNKGDGNQGSADGLQGAKAAMNANGLQGTITEVKCRKRKPRPKKRKQNNCASAPINIVESSESHVPRQQSDNNGEHASAEDSKATKIEINQTKSDCAPNNSV